MGDRKVVVGSKWQGKISRRTAEVSRIDGPYIYFVGYSFREHESEFQRSWDWVSDPPVKLLPYIAVRIVSHACCDGCKCVAERAGLRVGAIVQLKQDLGHDLYSFGGVSGDHFVKIEKAPDPYLPTKGERVRVTELMSTDTNPGCKVGDVLTVMSLGSGESGYVLIRHERGIAWCRVEKVIAPKVTFTFDVASIIFPPLGRSLTFADIKPSPVVNEAARVRFNTAVAKIGPNAQALLADIAERLAIGAAEHGDFDKPRTPKEWSKEAYEEDLDALVYRTLRLKAAA